MKRRIKQANRQSENTQKLYKTAQLAKAHYPLKLLQYWMIDSAVWMQKVVWPIQYESKSKGM